MARKYDKYGNNRQFKTNPASRRDPFPRDNLPFQDVQSNPARAAKVAGKPIPKRYAPSRANPPRSTPKVQGHSRADVEKAWASRRAAVRAMRQAHPDGGLGGYAKTHEKYYVAKVMAGTFGVVYAPMMAYNMASNVSAWAAYYAANPAAEGVAEWNRFGLPAWKRALSRRSIQRGIGMASTAYGIGTELHDLYSRPDARKALRLAQRHI